jgi:hypothetical protein
MGLIRKMMSVSTLGAVDFRSDKERTAAYTRRSATEARKQSAEVHRQTLLLEQMAAAKASQPVAYVEALVPPPPPPPPPPAPDTLASDLRGLAELRESGVLTEEEFQELKRRRLNP